MPGIVGRRRVIGVVGGAALAAAALFGSGVLVANATMGDDDNTATPPGDGAHANEIARDGGAVPAIGVNMTNQGGASSGKASPSIAPMPIDGMYPAGGCGAPITAALTGTAVDPAKMGFTANLLKDGFTLTGMAFASQGQCGDAGQVTDAHLVLRTQWTGADGVAVSVSQQQGADPGTANFIQQSNATFVSGGYMYAVWANSSAPIPVDKRLPGTSAAGTQSSPPSVQLNQDSTKVLEAAVSQLAPEIGLQCFWRQVEGTWSDLPAIGAGDPRGAIPAGFSENGMSLMRLQAPAAGCASTSAAPYAGQVTFYAMFSNGNGGQIYLNVNGGAGGEAANQPGRLDDNSASWSDHNLYFSVSMNGDGASKDAIAAIAKALDPGFGGVCLMTSRKPTDADLSKLGLHAPKTPSGYQLDQAQLTSLDGSPACGSAPAGFAAVWMFLNTDKAGYIEAGVTGGQTQYPGVYGNVTPTSLVWHDAAGNAYHVSSLKAEVGRDVLLAVATSMDPKFDEGRLETPPTGIAVPGGGSGSSGGGTAAVPPSAAVKPN